MKNFSRVKNRNQEVKQKELRWANFKAAAWLVFSLTLFIKLLNLKSKILISCKI